MSQNYKKFADRNQKRKWRGAAASSSLTSLGSMVRAKKTKEQLYYTHVVKFMHFLNTVYQPLEENEPVLGLTVGGPWTEEEMFRLKPHHVSSYLEWLAYGVIRSPPLAHPKNRRSEGLMFVKKALSFFMPNKEMQWNTQMKCGNPTKSERVNQLIEDVKVWECQKQGKSSNVKRNMKHNEFKNSMRSLFHRKNGIDR